MTTEATSVVLAEHIVGRRLSGVTFVMDYVQLQFDPPPTVNCLTPMTVRSNGREAKSGDDQFRNLLCAQIPKVVAAIALRQAESFDVIFADGSLVSTSLRREDYVGVEALNVYGKNHLCVVI
jgi:hypothetical protein